MLEEPPIEQSTGASTFEKREPLTNPLFSRDLAFKRAKIGSRKLGISFPEDALGKLGKEHGQQLETDGNVLEIRDAADNWYALIYDNKTQYHYYIGLDGEPIPVRYDTTNLPSITPGVSHKLVVDHDLKGNSPAIRDEVTQITDAAVATIPRESKYFEYKFAGDLSLLQKEIETLPLDQYISLMQKLSGHFATHVTRIGVREIIAGFHQAGLGNYFSAACELFESKALASPYVVAQNTTSTGEVYGEEDMDIEELSRCVHVAPELVDQNYGAELDNCPFVLFPAEILFANKTFSSKFDFNPKQSAGWANWEISGTNPDSLHPDNQLALNLGIIFLPKSTPVNPETGSKFEIANGKGVIHEERVRTLGNLLDSEIALPETFEEIKKKYYGSFYESEYQYKEAKEVYEQMLSQICQNAGFDKNLSFFQMKKIVENLEDWRNQLRSFDRRYHEETKPERRAATLSVMGMDQIESEDEFLNLTFDKGKEYFLRGCLFEAFALYLPSRNIVPAQEYWEQWFAAHPEARPTRVIYYDEDPNEAIWRFMSNNKIIERNDLEHALMSDKITGLKYRDVKPLLPQDAAPDIGIFRLHEWGNWMYRIANTIEAG